MKIVNRKVIGQINISCTLSEFDQLKELFLRHVNILVVCENKLDEIFPSFQFHTNGFSLPYRLDKNYNGGDVMIFVKEYIPNLWQNIIFQVMMKVFLLNLISENQNGFSLVLIINLYKMLYLYWWSSRYLE